MRIGARVLGWLALAICLLTTVPAAAGFVCVVDWDCDDGLFCNGTGFCVEGSCVALSACPPFVDGCVTSLGCDEITDTCLVGPDDSLCDDGVFCNGVEQCNGDTKECAAIDSCPAAIVGCVTYGSCDEDTDTCKCSFYALHGGHSGSRSRHTQPRRFSSPVPYDGRY